jgi:plastocyanin
LDDADDPSDTASSGGNMRIRALISAIGAIAAAACSGGESGGPTGPDQVPEGDVQVRNNFFDPAELTVAPGTTVVWAWNSGGVTHDIVFDDGADSGEQSSGTYERTFPTAGQFPYHCSIHGQSMSGVVNVDAAAAPDGGGGGDKPDGPGGGNPYG